MCVTFCSGTLSGFIICPLCLTLTLLSIDLLCLRRTNMSTFMHTLQPWYHCQQWPRANRRLSSRTHTALSSRSSPCFAANHSASPLCNDQSWDHSEGHSVSLNEHSVRNNKISQESLSTLLLVFQRHVGKRHWVRAALCNVGRLFYLKLVDIRQWSHRAEAGVTERDLQMMIMWGGLSN